MKNKYFNSIYVLAVFFISFSLGCDDVTRLSGDKTMIDLDDGSRIAKASDESIPAEKQQNYKHIAEKLAVEYVNSNNPTQTSIPENVVDFFYNGLLHLYSSGLNEARLITREYRMIARSPADPREVLLWTDTSKPWLDNWRQEITLTGIDEIDELIERFNLSLFEYRELSITSPGAIAHMRSDEPINVYAIGKAFENLQEIERAGPDVLLTGGRDVEATVSKDYLLLDITVGSGDCPAGCINKINHQFKIFSDGTVELAK